MIFNVRQRISSINPLIILVYGKFFDSELKKKIEMISATIRFNLNFKIIIFS